MNRARQTHEFGPCYDLDSRILILGSFPSVKSREEGFYYGHPMNRFWKLLALLYQEKVPKNICANFGRTTPLVEKGFFKKAPYCALGCH